MCQEEFWNRLASDPDFLDKSFADATLKGRVAKGASDVVVARARSITRHRFKDHLPDVLVFLVIGLALYGLFHRRTPTDSAASQLVVVSKTEGLNPFQTITRFDLTLGSGPVSPSTFASVEDVVGRYAMEHIAKGKILERSKVSNGPRLSNELDQRRIFQIKLQPSPVLAGVQPPVVVGLFASPRDKDSSSALIHDLYILDVHSDPNGISAVVATSVADFDKLAPLISRSDLIAIGPAH